MTTLVEAVSAVKAALARGDEAYAEAGRYLAIAKSKKPKEIPWAKFVAENFGLNKTRADELIRIAKKITTVKEVREKRRVRDKKTKERRMDAVGVHSERHYTKPFSNGNGRSEMQNLHAWFGTAICPKLEEKFEEVIKHASKKKDFTVDTRNNLLNQIILLKQDLDKWTNQLLAIDLPEEKNVVRLKRQA